MNKVTTVRRGTEDIAINSGVEGIRLTDADKAMDHSDEGINSLDTWV